MTPTCSQGVCTSVCEPGWSNCDQPQAPDPDDGCEAHSPGCCGTLPEKMHTNGLGQSFYDCVLPNTYNATQAKEAAQAFNSNGSPSERDSFDSNNSNNTASGICIADPNNTICVCWTYAPTGSWTAGIGEVSKSTDTTCTNAIGAGLPMWN